MNHGTGFWLLIGALGLSSIVMVWALVPFTLCFVTRTKRPRRAAVGMVELRTALLALNDSERPFRVVQTSETEMRLDWNVVDASWYEVFAKVKLTASYRARLLFHEPAHEVRCHEVIRSSNWWLGFELEGWRLRFNWSVFYLSGALNVIWVGKAYGILRGFPPRIGKVYDFALDTPQAKRDIETVARSLGWIFRPVAFRLETTARGTALAQRLTPAFAREWSRKRFWGTIYVAAWIGIIAVGVAGNLAWNERPSIRDFLFLAVFPGVFVGMQVLVVQLWRAMER